MSMLIKNGISAAVLTFAVFAGVESCFSFLSVAGPLHDPASIAQFCGAAFAGVSDYLGYMAVFGHSLVSTLVVPY